MRRVWKPSKELRPWGMSSAMAVSSALMLSASSRLSTFGTIEYADQDGSSLYHGLELTVERRFSHGFGFRTAYTLSKATDNSGEHLFTGGSPSFLQDATNRGSWQGPADQDTRHRVAANWISSDSTGSKSGTGPVFLLVVSGTCPITSA